ncbi:MAG: UshA-like (seleno)protein [Desulfobulbaceae bacterium]
MGGLSRKAYMIKQVESEVDKPVLRLDAGALFFERPGVPDALLEARTIQARGISRAMQAMQYAAIGTAPHDLAAGLEFLHRQSREFSLPLLSANLRNQEGTSPFPASLLTKIGETSVAIIGLTGESAPNEADRRSGEYRLLSWEEVLPDTLQDVAKHAEMIILLSSYPEKINRVIAGRFPDIHLIIQSGASPAGKAPEIVGNTLITQVAARGKYLGRLDIDWKKSRRWGQEQGGHAKLRQARDELDRINWRLGRLEKRWPNKEELALINEYQTLRKDQQRLTMQIAELEAAPRDEEEELSSFRAVFIPLQVALTEDPEVQKIVIQTKQEINQAGKKRLSDAAQQPEQPVRKGRGMSGWQECGACHIEQTAFWQESRHAGAWQTLVRARQQFNQECLRCHVTLPSYDQEVVHSENLLAEVTPDLQQVGCEACHGPGEQHVANPERTHFPPVTARICLNCHTPEHDNDFDFERKTRIIRCPPMMKNKGAA